MKDYVKNNMGIQRRFDKLKDNQSYYFDKLIMTGCKQYYLNKKLFDGEYIETKKLKGLRQGKKKDKSKFIYESQRDMLEKVNGKPLGQVHYEKLINDGEIFQNQEQFRNPLANHLDENNPFAINIIVNGKKFKQVYTKGKKVVHNGKYKGIEITPWNYPEDYTNINGNLCIDFSQPPIEANVDTLITQN